MPSNSDLLQTDESSRSCVALVGYRSLFVDQPLCDHVIIAYIMQTGHKGDI